MDEKAKKAAVEEKGFDQLTGLIEALIYISEEPINHNQLVKLTELKPREVSSRLERLMEFYRHGSRGIRLTETAGGYRFETDPSYSPVLKKLFKTRDTSRLSRPAMETLAIIAYKQPVTTPEINDIRSVDSGGVIHSLLEKKLIRIIGRKEVVGKPLLYGTTKDFLIRFGLNTLESLPSIEEFLNIVEVNGDRDKLKKEFLDHFQRGEKDNGKNQADEKTDEEEINNSAGDDKTGLSNLEDKPDEFHV